MGRYKRRLPLKRVGGEVRLASVDLESSQPSIKDIPLKRCSNETDINYATATTPSFHAFHQYYQRSFINRSAELGVNFTKSISSSQIKTAQRSRQRYLSHTLLNSGGSTQAISGNLVVPNNSVATSPVAANKCQTLPHSLANSTAGSIETPLVEKFHHHNRPRHNELPFSRNVLSNDERCSSIGPTLSKFASTQVTYQPTAADPLDVKAGATSPVEEISTATTLELPGSNRDLLLNSGPSAWSMTLQHPKSPILSQTIVDRKMALASSRTTVDSSGGGGDHGGSSPPTRIEQAKSSTPTEIAGPPPSARTSTSGKPTFMLTFRKPKPRPRSIITNRSARGSLPTTASTPNSQLPVAGINNDGDENNNAEQVPLLPIPEDVENNNNNNVKKSDENDDTLKGCKKSSDKLPNYVFDMREGATSKNQVTALPAGLEDPEPEPSEFPPTEPTTAAAEGEAELELIAMAEVSKPGSLEKDESFWRSDSTNEETVHSGPAVSPSKSKTSKSRRTSSRRMTELTQPSSGSYTSETKTKSEESKYPKSSYGYNSKPSYNTTYNRSDAPFITTEKGAIRFHLPGRIQHKTTIKVAHFPITEEKNVILNVTPDKEDDCDLPCDPLCANNQNFSVPPCPQPYSSYPYSYPNYYGYYGYPPYC